jgi:hypothetical protein
VVVSLQEGNESISLYQNLKQSDGRNLLKLIWITLKISDCLIAVLQHYLLEPWQAMTQNLAIGTSCIMQTNIFFLKKKLKNSRSFYAWRHVCFRKI